MLSKEEISILLNEKIIRLLNLRDLLQSPTKEEAKEFLVERQRNLDNQLLDMVEYRQVRSKMYLNNSNIDNTTTNNGNKKRKVMDEQHKREKDIMELKGHEIITINLLSPELLKIMSNMKEDYSWHFPNTKEEKERYAIYYDLWKKGYFISNGSKFGGDFLVYPGDPLQYHAHYVIIVVSFQFQLSYHDIISYGRLGVTVKKTPVIASVRFYSDEKPYENQINYFSVDWQGVT